MTADQRDGRPPRAMPGEVERGKSLGQRAADKLTLGLATGSIVLSGAALQPQVTRTESACMDHNHAVQVDHERRKQKIDHADKMRDAAEGLAQARREAEKRRQAARSHAAAEASRARTPASEPPGGRDHTPSTSTQERTRPRERRRGRGRS